MSTPTLAIIFILLIFGGGFLFFGNRAPEQSTHVMEDGTVMKNSDSVMNAGQEGVHTMPDGTIMRSDGTHVMSDGTMMADTDPVMQKEVTPDPVPTPPAVPTTPVPAVAAEQPVVAPMPMDHSMMGHGSYETYTDAKLVRAKTADVVLFFRASWCPTCKALDADIRKNLMSIPKDVLILDVNYDTALDLKKKYGVTYQHTLVQVDSEGNQIARWEGSRTLSALVSEIK